MRVKNRRSSPVTQLGMVHRFVMWQAGKKQWETLVCFLFCFFSWKLWRKGTTFGRGNSRTFVKGLKPPLLIMGPGQRIQSSSDID